MKRALITGITGQDGSYLAEFLLAKGYEVHGVIRRSSSFNTGRIEHLYQDPHEESTRLFLHYGDLTDSVSLHRILEKVQPQEIYNLAGQTHVRLSFDIPEYTSDVTGLGALRLMEAIIDTKLPIRFYQASSSEMFGKVLEVPQQESTPFYPRSPYGVSKAFAHWATVNYREAYGMHASCGILFNHESPRRGEHFVTRKITRAVAKILAGKQHDLYLGNLDARRDWGYTPDYVEAMWLMLQQPQGDDFVIATGETHSVQEFVELAFGLVGLNWQEFVKKDPRYYRPSEVDLLIGDPSKARKVLGWEPRVKFEGLVRIMLEADLKLEGLTPEKYLKKGPIAAPTVIRSAPARMHEHSRVLVAGASGLVGSAIARTLRSEGFDNLLAPRRSELNLLDQKAVDEWFRKSEVEYVFLAAAKVGGIHANNSFPADFLLENLLIGANVIGAAARHGVKKLLFLGSSCIYPRLAPQPIPESALLTGSLEPTNEAYALAKITGLKLAEYYRKQLQKNFISVMPCNLYGSGDNFHPENSHVIPGMMRKFHEAKTEGAPKVILWGSGNPRREFLHVEDLAKAVHLLMLKYEGAEPINVGSGQELTIRELAELMKSVVGYRGKIEFDTTKPDGIPRKLLDVSRVTSLGWKPTTDLSTGLTQLYEWALQSGALTNRKAA